MDANILGCNNKNFITYSIYVYESFNFCLTISDRQVMLIDNKPVTGKCMDANKPLGGRGKVAPYTTSIVRVPDPIRSEVESMIAEYRKAVFEGLPDCTDPLDTYQKILGAKGVPKSEAIDKAKSVLKRKKAAKYSLTKLLQELYDDKSIQL